MKTVNEIAQLAHVSVRTLHHYDAIGLLKPTQITEAGYRLYDDAAIEKLYMILVFRELGLSLKETAKEQMGQYYSDYAFHQFFLQNGPSDFCTLTQKLKEE